jgi:hypothetical protein
MWKMMLATLMWRNGWTFKVSITTLKLVMGNLKVNNILGK